MKRRWFFPLVLLCWGCSQSPPTSAEASATTQRTDTTLPEDAPQSAPSSRASASAPPTTPPCAAAETPRLQAAIDRAHPSTTDAVLVIKSPCGTRFFASGPSQLTESALHRMASVTKTYTGGVIHTLVRDHVLSYDDPASRWVDGVPSGDQITIRDLLSHRSGLFDYFNDDAWYARVAADPRRHWDPEELVAVAAGHPLDFAPNTATAYSNSNYVVLGLIAEAAAKAPLHTLMRTRLFRPIGLTKTFLDSAEPHPGFKVVVGLGSEDLDPTFDLSASWGCGAVVASPTDVATWIEQIGSGKFYPPAIQQGLFATESELGDADGVVNAGLGILSFDSGVTGVPDRCVGHDGSLPGAHSIAIYCPRFNTTLVAIHDADPVGDELGERDVLRAAAGVLFGASTKPSPKKVAPSWRRR